MSNLFFQSINQQGLTTQERRERRWAEYYAKGLGYAFSYGVMHGDHLVKHEIPRAKAAGLRSVTVDLLEVRDRHRDDIHCDVFDWLDEYFEGMSRQLNLPP